MFVFIKIAQATTGRFFRSFKKGRRETDEEFKKKADTLSSITASVLTVVIVIIAAITIMGELEIPIGPILASILMVAASPGQVGEGTILLTFYSMGLGVPFLLSGLLFHQFLGVFKRLRMHMRKIEIGTGIMLIAVGIMLMFGLLGPITMFFYRYIPVQG